MNIHAQTERRLVADYRPGEQVRDRVTGSVGSVQRLAEDQFDTRGRWSGGYVHVQVLERGRRSHHQIGDHVIWNHPLGGNSAITPLTDPDLVGADFYED